jgi:hypothetical protein
LSASDSANWAENSPSAIRCSLAACQGEDTSGLPPRAWIAGSGPTADQLASAARGGPADERAVRLAASGLVEVVDADDLAALDRAVGARLRRPV